ncbi:hypothetical protein [Desulfotignum balticum]|uniref:hypothetical protein n=1 Tax=Desulfotignum balticum TaxID=115781 RepID=UPI0003FBCCFA|nr:hypothetical protein [Desulfotignum balticum]
MSPEQFYDQYEAVTSDYVWFTYHPEDLALAEELEEQSRELLNLAASGQINLDNQSQVCATLYKINDHVLTCLSGIDFSVLEKELAFAQLPTTKQGEAA